jgi:hypothetical protein
LQGGALACGTITNVRATLSATFPLKAKPITRADVQTASTANTVKFRDAQTTKWSTDQGGLCIEEIATGAAYGADGTSYAQCEKPTNYINGATTWTGDGRCEVTGVTQAQCGTALPNTGFGLFSGARPGTDTLPDLTYKWNDVDGKCEISAGGVDVWRTTGVAAYDLSVTAKADCVLGSRASGVNTWAGATCYNPSGNVNPALTTQAACEGIAAGYQWDTGENKCFDPAATTQAACDTMERPDRRYDDTANVCMQKRYVQAPDAASCTGKGVAATVALQTTPVSIATGTAPFENLCIGGVACNPPATAVVDLTFDAAASAATAYAWVADENNGCADVPTFTDSVNAMFVADAGDVVFPNWGQPVVGAVAMAESSLTLVDRAAGALKSVGTYRWKVPLTGDVLAVKSVRLLACAGGSATRQWAVDKCVNPAVLDATTGLPAVITGITDQFSCVCRTQTVLACGDVAAATTSQVTAKARFADGTVADLTQLALGGKTTLSVGGTTAADKLYLSSVPATAANWATAGKTLVCTADGSADGSCANVLNAPLTGAASVVGQTLVLTNGADAFKKSSKVIFTQAPTTVLKATLAAQLGGSTVELRRSTDQARGAETTITAVLQSGADSSVAEWWVGTDACPAAGAIQPTSVFDWRQAPPAYSGQSLAASETTCHRSDATLVDRLAACKAGDLTSVFGKVKIGRAADGAETTVVTHTAMSLEPGASGLVDRSVWLKLADGSKLCGDLVAVYGRQAEARITPATVATFKQAAPLAPTLVTLKADRGILQDLVVYGQPMLGDVVANTYGIAAIAASSTTSCGALDGATPVGVIASLGPSSSTAMTSVSSTLTLFGSASMLGQSLGLRNLQNKVAACATITPLGQVETSVLRSEFASPAGTTNPISGWTVLMQPSTPCEAGCSVAQPFWDGAKCVNEETGVEIVGATETICGVPDILQNLGLSIDLTTMVKLANGAGKPGVTGYQYGFRKSTTLGAAAGFDMDEYGDALKANHWMREACAASTDTFKRVDLVEGAPVAERRITAPSGSVSTVSKLLRTFDRAEWVVSTNQASEYDYAAADTCALVHDLADWPSICDPSNGDGAVPVDIRTVPAFEASDFKCTANCALRAIPFVQNCRESFLAARAKTAKEESDTAFQQSGCSLRSTCAETQYVAKVAAAEGSEDALRNWETVRQQCVAKPATLLMAKQARCAAAVDACPLPGPSGGCGDKIVRLFSEWDKASCKSTACAGYSQPGDCCWTGAKTLLASQPMVTAWRAATDAESTKAVAVVECIDGLAKHGQFSMENYRTELLGEVGAAGPGGAAGIPASSACSTEPSAATQCPANAVANAGRPQVGNDKSPNPGGPCVCQQVDGAGFYADRVGSCIAKQTCSLPPTPTSAGYYESNAGTDFTDRTCTALTVCTQTQFLRTASNGKTNNDCATIAPECGADQYQTQTPTLTQDRLCADLLTCDADTQYQTAAPTTTTDRECAALRICDADTDYQTAAPTATTNRACAPLTVCTTTQWESVAKRPTSNRQCRPLTPECAASEVTLAKPNEIMALGVGTGKYDADRQCGVAPLSNANPRTQSAKASVVGLKITGEYVTRPRILAGIAATVSTTSNKVTGADVAISAITQTASVTLTGIYPGFVQANSRCINVVQQVAKTTEAACLSTGYTYTCTTCSTTDRSKGKCLNTVGARHPIWDPVDGTQDKCEKHEDRVFYGQKCLKITEFTVVAGDTCPAGARLVQGLSDILATGITTALNSKNVDGERVTATPAVDAGGRRRRLAETLGGTFTQRFVVTKAAFSQDVDDLTGISRAAFKTSVAASLAEGDNSGTCSAADKLTKGECDDPAVWTAWLPGSFSSTVTAFSTEVNFAVEQAVTTSNAQTQAHLQAQLMSATELSRGIASGGCVDNAAWTDGGAVAAGACDKYIDFQFSTTGANPSSLYCPTMQPFQCRQSKAATSTDPCKSWSVVGDGTTDCATSTYIDDEDLLCESPVAGKVAVRTSAGHTCYLADCTRPGTATAVPADLLGDVNSATDVANECTNTLALSTASPFVADDVLTGRTSNAKAQVTKVSADGLSIVVLPIGLCATQTSAAAGTWAADRDLCNAVTLLATAEACNNILTSDDDDVSACLLVLPIRILDLHSTAVVEHGQEGLHLHAQRLHWR